MAACSNPPREQAAAPPARNGQLFTLLLSSYTGVTFANRLDETRDFNVFTYRNFYNGGGGAIGDLRGENLPQIVLTYQRSGPRPHFYPRGFMFCDMAQESGSPANRRLTARATVGGTESDGK